MEEQNSANANAEHDSSTRSRSAKMLQAASPYLDVPAKQTLEVVVRITDFMEIMQSMQQRGPMNYFQQLMHPQNVSAANLKHGSSGIDMENAFRSIRPFCNQQELGLIDRVLNMLNMRKYMQMYQTMQSMMSDMNTTNNTDNKSTSGFNTQDFSNMANMAKMAQAFSSMNNSTPERPKPAQASTQPQPQPASDYYDTANDSLDDLNFYDFETDTPITSWEEDTIQPTQQLKAAEHKATDNSQKNQQMLDLLATMIPPDQKNTFDAMKIIVESGVLNTK